MTFERAFIREAVGVDGDEVNRAVMSRENDKMMLLWVSGRRGVNGRVKEGGDGAFGDGGFVKESVSWSER